MVLIMAPRNNFNRFKSVYILNLHFYFFLHFIYFYFYICLFLYISIFIYCFLMQHLKNPPSARHCSANLDLSSCLQSSWQILGSKPNKYLDPNLINTWIQTWKILGSKPNKYLDPNLINTWIQIINTWILT